MAPPPEFLDLDDVLELHAHGLARWGGTQGIRDRGALSSAIAQPEATFGGEYVHEDHFAMAAAYAFTSPRRRRSSTGISARACSPP